MPTKWLCIKIHFIFSFFPMSKIREEYRHERKNYHHNPAHENLKSDSVDLSPYNLIYRNFQISETGRFRWYEMHLASVLRLCKNYSTYMPYMFHGFPHGTPAGSPQDETIILWIIFTTLAQNLKIS